MIVEQLRNILILAILIAIVWSINIFYKSNNPICPDDYVDWNIAVKALSQHYDDLSKENLDVDLGPVEIERHFAENCEEDLKIYDDYITKNAKKEIKTPDPQVLVTRELLYQSYDSLYDSRRVFDAEIKKLNRASKNMKFLWHPSYEKKQYISGVKKSTVEESVINIGKYRLTITSPRERAIDYDDYYTHIVITKDGKSAGVQDYKKVNFDHIYKIQVGEVSYYLFGLCGGGMHGCGILIPIIYTSNELTVGKIIDDADFSNYLRINDFFTINSELYLVLDDSRYFFSYSGSNNASYNSAIPRIFKFDKETANLVLAVNDFADLYKKAAKKMEKDLYSLKDNVPSKMRPLIMNRPIGKSLIPYFDYYLGVAIIADPTHSSETRKKVEKLYIDFYGKENSPEAHFDGYKDFEI